MSIFQVSQSNLFLTHLLRLCWPQVQLQIHQRSTTANYLLSARHPKQLYISTEFKFGTRDFFQPESCHIAGCQQKWSQCWIVPSCHLGEHMVCIIQMGRVGSRIATPMLAKHREPTEKKTKMMLLWHLFDTCSCHIYNNYVNSVNNFSESFDRSTNDTVAS